MTDLRLKELSALRDSDRDVRSMCAVVMTAEGATSLGMLLDVAPEVFAELLETAREMHATLADGLD